MIKCIHVKLHVNMQIFYLKNFLLFESKFSDSKRERERVNGLDETFIS